MITITIRDKASRVNFLKLKVKNDDFINALFGLSEVECLSKVNGLELVGKTRQQEPFSIRVPCRTFGDKQEYEQDLIDACPDGWEINSHISSQNSIENNEDDMVTLNTYIYRYV